MGNNKLIYFVLGTKAQFIKSKHILIKLHEQGYKVIIVNTNQHIEITKKQLHSLNFEFETFSLSKNKKNISSVSSMILWFIKILKKIAIERPIVRKGYCLVHGDTVTTLIGLLFSKKNNLRCVHIESGLTSGNLLNPFPEEIVRRIVSKFSEILSIDNQEILNNNLKLKNKKIILLKRNTIYDSIIENENIFSNEIQSKLIITVHRTENIYSKERMTQLVNLIIELTEKLEFESIQWFCHDVTKKSLNKYNLMSKISKVVSIEELVSHEKFIGEIITSKLIITDGGSIAEECSILNKNTLIWRNTVENKEYLNQNVILTNYDKKVINKFISNLKLTKMKKFHPYSPSEDFVNQLSLIKF